MTDFGKMFDDAVAKREQAQSDARAQHQAKLDQEQAERKELGRQLETLLEPALLDLNKQLASRGIILNQDPPLSMTSRGDFRVLHAFTLSRKNSHGGTTTGATHAFRVYPGGNIEGCIIEDIGGHRKHGERIFLAKPVEFDIKHIHSVFQHAIEDLVGR